jgi:hypothetical protein
LLLYLLAPVWTAAIAWHSAGPTSAVTDADNANAPDDPPRAVWFETPAKLPPLPDLVLHRDVPHLAAPEGTAPVPAAVDAPATLPHAPQVAAPWAGQPLELDLIPIARGASDQTLSPSARQTVPAGVLSAGGFGGHSHDRVTTKDDTELRDVSQGEVPTVVPSPPGAVFGPPLPPDLARVVAAWDRLPEAIKAGILALVQAAGGPDA